MIHPLLGVVPESQEVTLEETSTDRQPVEPLMAATGVLPHGPLVCDHGRLLYVTVAGSQVVVSSRRDAVLP